MRYSILFLIVTLVGFSVKAQITFEKTFGGDYEDYGYSVVQTNDGGFVLTGGYGLPGDDSDVFLIKTDELGNQEWMKTYGSNSYEYGISLINAPDNGYFIVGRQGHFGNWNIYLIKADENGDLIWSETYGLGGINDMAIDCQQTNDDGYIITGRKGTFDNEDVFLMKLDLYGDTIWTKKYGGSGTDSGNAVQQTSDNGYIISGWTYSFGAGQCDAYLIKTNENGDASWTKTYGTTGYDYGGPVIQTDDDGYMISGSTDNSGSDGMDLYLIRTDSNGDTLWTRTYISSGWESAISMVETNDNNYLILSKYNEEGGTEDIFMRKIDHSGNTLWTNVFGESGNDGGYCVKETSDNGFVITGTSYNVDNGNYDIYLLKTDDNGLVLGVEQNNIDAFSSKIFPNPNDGFFTIDLGNEFKSVISLEIVNLRGQTIYTRKADNIRKDMVHIDLSNCEKGMLFVRIYFEHTCVVEKILIN
jgi:hypothetical protein